MANPLKPESVQESTQIGDIEKSKKIWEKILKDNKDLTTDQKTKINNNVRYLTAAKTKILKYYFACKDQGLIKPGSMTTFYALSENNFAKASITAIKQLIDSTKDAPGVNLEAKAEKQWGFLDFLENKSPFGLASLAKTLTGATIAGALFTPWLSGSAAAPIIPMFKAVGWIWTLNPALAIGISAIAAVGLLKLFTKTFGPEINKFRKNLAKAKEAKEIDKEYQAKLDQEEFESQLKSFNEGKGEEEKAIGEREKEEKKQEKIQLKRVIEDYKARIAKVNTSLSDTYKQENFRLIIEEMKEGGFTEDQIKKEFPELEEFMKKAPVPPKSKKGTDYSKIFKIVGESTDYETEYKVVVEEYNDIMGKIFNATTSDKEIDSAIEKLNKQSFDGNKENLRKALVAILKEAHRMRKENEISSESDKKGVVKGLLEGHNKGAALDDTLEQKLNS